MDKIDFNILETGKVRKSCKDIWNAYMAKGVKFTGCDIPLCPTTKQLPDIILEWQEAQEWYRKRKNKSIRLKRKNKIVFVCFYNDDYLFDDGKQTSIWDNPMRALKILKFFDGMITIDYSTFQDFPDPIKRNATYRMRLLGYWCGKKGIQVINNVRWGSWETYEYCFNGIEYNSIVAIGTVGGSPHKLCDRERFEKGLEKMMEVLNPHTIIVYGSANYPCFKKLEKDGVKIMSFESRTSKVYKGRD